MANFDDRGRAPPVADHQKELVKLFHSLSGRHSHWQVFSDFCEMAAISMSNAVDLHHYETREARYMQMVKGYNRTELDLFMEGFKHLTLAMDAKTQDVLGRTYHDLELHNKWAGQFFTPYDVSRMMAQMTIGNGQEIKAKIEERGYITTLEPAVGSGAMIVAFAHELHEAGINYQQHLHVTAVDIDPKCVHMAYLQFSLLHIPAVIIHGDTLAMKEYSHWFTPAHILDGWQWRLHRAAEKKAVHEVQTPPLLSTPANTDTPTEADAPRGQLKLF
jgi:N-6 DNA Methylase